MSPLQEKDKLRALTAAFIAATGVALVGLVLAIVWIGLGNKHNGDILIDCTTPGHNCYERAQQQTGQAVGSINQITISANYCSYVLNLEGRPLSEGRFKEFVVCVTDHVALLAKVKNEPN